MGYKLKGLIEEKSNKLVWERIMIDMGEGLDYKMVWYNRETEEIISTYKLNRLKNRDEFLNLWEKY
jgi:hypothetical protein